MRVSSDNNRQTTALQRDALLQAGVDARHLFEDKASGARDDRPGLAEALAFVHEGDCLVVWKLDRLGRSLPYLLSIVTDLQSRGVAFRSLTGLLHESSRPRTIPTITPLNWPDRTAADPLGIKVTDSSLTL